MKRIEFNIVPAFGLMIASTTDDYSKGFAIIILCFGVHFDLTTKKATE